MKSTLQRLVLSLLISLFVLSFSQPAQSQTVGFEDTFDDPALPGWQHSPNVYAENGVLRIEPGGFAAHTGQWHSYEMMLLARWSGAGQMAFILHASETGRSILIYDGERFQLQRETGEQVENIGEAVPFAIPGGEFLPLTFSVSPGILRVLVGEELAMEAPLEETPLPGGIGFETMGDLTLELEHILLSSADAGLIEEPPVEEGEQPPAEDGEETPEAVQTEAPPTISDQPPAYQSEPWIRLGGPMGGLGYDIRHSFEDYDTWYVTDAWTGIFRSTDRGLTWVPINQGIASTKGVDAIPIFSATIDPHDSDVIWIGTDYSGEIYRTSDGGDSWVLMINGIDRSLLPMSFRGFTIDPIDQDTVYAMAEVSSSGWSDDGMPQIGLEMDRTMGIVYKTTDGGQNWVEIWRGDNLARYCWINPNNTDVLYVSTGIFDRESANTDPEAGIAGGVGILKSTDGGDTWRVLNQDNGLLDLYVSSLFMHPEDPETLLAAAAENNWSSYFGDFTSGVFMTQDGGENWERVLAGPELFSAVEICIADPSIVYAASPNAAYRSDDGGFTWKRFSRPNNTWGPPGIIAGNPIDMQCDPENPMRVMVNNYLGGNFLSEDGAKTWTDASQGYSGELVYSLAVAPGEPGWVYDGSRSGVFRSTDGGVTWVGLANPGEGFPEKPMNETASLAVNPQDPRFLLAGLKELGYLVYSSDGGNTWDLSSGMQGPPNDLVFAPSDPLKAFAATSMSISEQFDGTLMLEARENAVNHFYTSQDGGKTWQEDAGADLPGGGFVALAVHPEESDTLYAATIDPGVVKTEDGGKTWLPVGAGLPDNMRVESVALDPSQPDTIFVGYTEGGIYKSSDGGLTWHRITAGLIPEAFVKSIVVDPTNGEIVYLADQRSGVYVSTDGGETWSGLNEGLTHRSVNVLALSDDGTVLYVGIEGGGVYRLGTPPEVQGADDMTSAAQPAPEVEEGDVVEGAAEGEAETEGSEGDQGEDAAEPLGLLDWLPWLISAVLLAIVAFLFFDRRRRSH
jgi:photosystem II stability/assembly factor-like uncharacterized protein